MKRLPSLLRLLAVAVFVVSALPARAQQPLSPCVPPPAQQPAIQCFDFFLSNTSSVPAVSIHVRQKVGAQPTKVPVLLIHGTWGNAQAWDFPGRSVMDYLAVRGYDVYALDLRGEGSSGPTPPVDYRQIDILTRVSDAAVVAGYIVQNTGRAPVVIGWSQGGVIAGILAATPSTQPLVVGVGLFSVPPAGFTVPPQFGQLLLQIILTNPPSVQLTEDEINGIVFGTDPLTGKPTMSPAAEDTFYSLSAPDIDSTLAIEELVSPGFFQAVLPWGQIKVPALVVDGALDPLVGEELAQQLSGLLGSAKTQLIVFPRNSHAWFLEDNHDETIRVFDRFLSQF